MKKVILICMLLSFAVVASGCERDNSGNASFTDELFADDYLEYVTLDTADDFFKQCFEKIDGDWYSDDKTVGFYTEDNLYMMSGWSDKARIIAFIEPVRNNANQFEIGLEAGELQEILKCEIVDENKEIIIKETVFLRKE